MHTKMKIKILAFSPYPPCPGGGTKATYEIFKRLNPEFNIDLVTYQKELNKLNFVNIYHFNIPNGESILRGFRYITFGLIKSSFLCLKNKYNLIYVKNLTSPGIIGYLISKIFNIPLVVHTSGPDVEDIELLSRTYGSFSKFYQKLIRFFVRRQLISAKVIIANAKRDQEAVKSICEKNSKLIYNGVDFDLFNPSKGNLRKELGFTIKDRVCIFVGRAAKEKNIETILYAAEKLKNLKFLFVGPETKDLEKFGKIGENIIAIGNQKETSKYYLSADIFILPSYGEGTSNALLEALSCGLPVVAYPAGATPYLIKENINGFVVNNKERFIEKIDLLAKNKKLRNNISKNNRKFILENFDWNKTSKEVEEVFRSVTKK